ncbi:MAG: thioredoxin domain-containing protein [Planctomycetota bacterium]|nr:thioredoxin domain-containing protein [Planctomycetota bacterium]
MNTPLGNRLSLESSPYLKQHANNPVDWFPWSEEALAQAKACDKPIFLSIGYSACHWCHVMERESFEDPFIASFLNEYFVCIKVDREERPDLDQIYMTAVQLLTGHGGWPMSVFLFPDQRPFWGGTYFPPEDRYGRPGFLRLIRNINSWWQTGREGLAMQGDRMVKAIADLQHRPKVIEADPKKQEPTLALVENALKSLAASFDSIHGGFGEAPKFPHPMDLRLLLQAGFRRQDKDLVTMAILTLTRMARGGIFDHLGGGFARYSTDRIWLVPHFEKMLYDNALLLCAYTEAWQQTQNPLFQETVTKTVGWALREMRDESGGFYSAQDADTDYEEGKFYVWTLEEIQSVLGPERAPLFERAFGVLAQGNWEENNILRLAGTAAEIANETGIAPEKIQALLEESAHILKEVRDKRSRPGLDDKVLTAWNGLMIRALAFAGRVFDRSDWIDAAKVAARFLLEQVRDKDGYWYRSWTRASGPKQNAFLEDYAFLLDGLVELAQGDPAGCWTEEAVKLAMDMVHQFFDEETNTFFYTGKDHESLLVRPRDKSDNATPSANAMAITGLYRLGRLTSNDQFLSIAWEALCAHTPFMAKNPSSMGQMITVVESWLNGDGEWIFTGLEKQSPVYRALMSKYQGMNLLLNGEESGGLKISQGKTEGETEPHLYVCQGGNCGAPLIGEAAIFQFAKP